MDPLRNPKAWLRERGEDSRKALGQHFLVAEGALRRIGGHVAEAARRHAPAGPGGPLPVVEIGCGPGNLTRELLTLGLRVFAVELDRRFEPLHRETFAAALAEGRLAMRYGDALELPDEEIAGFCGGAPGYVLAGNIPYQITSPLIFQALDRLGAEPAPAAVVFLMQEEVARRTAATPADVKVYGVLSVKVRLLMEPRLLDRVPPGSFQPPPRVDSRVLLLEPRPAAERPTPEERERTWPLIERLFQQRRKTVAGVLGRARAEWRAAGLAFLDERGHPATARPENLPPEDFVALAARLEGV